VLHHSGLIADGDNNVSLGELAHILEIKSRADMPLGGHIVKNREKLRAARNGERHWPTAA